MQPLGDAMTKTEMTKETAKSFPTIRPDLLDRLSIKADRLTTRPTPEPEARPAP